MNKWKLLPRMAAKGMFQNGTVYYPYVMAGIFSAFTWFAFSSILSNDLMARIPRGAYAWMMLSIGRVLLGLILIPFLYYANSFLVKRRTREIGLYSILGLEKRHIGLMLLCESLITYVIVMAGGILLGVALSKLLFLFLLWLISFPVEADFVFTWQAFKSTLLFFAVVFLINFLYGLVQVGRSKPVELLQGSRKGEKEPRFTVIYAMLGVGFLAMGYAISIRSSLDSMIFLNFFLAVFWVVLGTYLLFTSGSVLFLKLLKKKKGFYYRPGNFVTVSGMLYRMKQNAVGLANICIFSTMVVITLVCTVVLYLGLNGITHHMFPYDVKINYAAGNFSQEEIREKAGEILEKNGVQAKRLDIYEMRSFSCSLTGNRFQMPVEDYEEDFRVVFLALEDYNRMSGENKALSPGQVLFYSQGSDRGFESLEFMGLSLEVAQELGSIYPYPKAGRDGMGTGYAIVVRDREALAQCVAAYAKESGVSDLAGFLESSYQHIGIVLEGSEAGKKGAVSDFIQWGRENQEIYAGHYDGIEERAQLNAMYGGLLFIGILFGLIFFMCLLLVMYYKQISEGYEDRGSFEIMQKVGMSGREIKSTVHRQILLVFFLPLAGALAHTAAGMFMVEELMAALQMFNGRLIGFCTVAASLIFILLYGVSYLATAKTYYKIVR